MCYLQLTNIYTCVFISKQIFSPVYSIANTVWPNYMFLPYCSPGMAALIPDSIDRIF